jgi:hypothetical protein
MIQIPRLSFDQQNGNLTLYLANLGLGDIFKPGYAQLYDISDYKWLFVTDLIHKTYLEVKENSQETRNIGKNQFRPNGDTIDVNFDKPFLFFIMDNISGLILSMGKYAKGFVNYKLPA